ncbi:MAG: hydantoinase/oxoprolinase family protein [Lacipirellulaceae bacterium]
MPASPTSRWIGLDVGGANLKASDAAGHGVTVRFPLWREPGRLAAELARLLSGFEPIDHVALTMTGELADCYETKSDGVRAIVSAVAEAAPDSRVRVATIDDAWLTPEEAVASTQRVAAANWRLTARLVARRLFERGDVKRALVLDAGSTTVDVVPIERGRVTAKGANDTERLLAGELVYTGVRRTPVCAIVSSLPFRGNDYPVAAELFATSGDAWLLLGGLPESLDDTDTADGRPFTHERARNRLARCVGADRDSFDEADALTAAHAIASAQARLVGAAIARQPGGSRFIVTCGEGECLLDAALRIASSRAGDLRFNELVGVRDGSARAPALAAAILASEEAPQ